MRGSVRLDVPVVPLHVARNPVHPEVWAIEVVVLAGIDHQLRGYVQPAPLVAARKRRSLAIT